MRRRVCVGLGTLKGEGTTNLRKNRLKTNVSQQGSCVRIGHYGSRSQNAQVLVISGVA